MRTYVAIVGFAAHSYCGVDKDDELSLLTSTRTVELRVD